MGLEPCGQEPFLVVGALDRALKAGARNGLSYRRRRADGRTTTIDDPVEGAEKNGLTYLLPCLHSHVPIDVVVLGLGTNDLKARFARSADDIAQGVATLIDVIRTSHSGPGGTAPNIVVTSPARFHDHLRPNETFAGWPEKLDQLPARLETIARSRGCDFLDLAPQIRLKAVDGIHFDETNHLAVCELLAPLIRNAAARR